MSCRALPFCLQPCFGLWPVKKASQALSLQRPLLLHDVDRHWVSQPKEKNLITIIPGSPTLANIIPRPINQNSTHTRFKNTHILPRSQALHSHTFSCPCQKPPFHTPSHFVSTFRRWKSAGSACCLI